MVSNKFFIDAYDQIEKTPFYSLFVENFVSRMGVGFFHVLFLPNDILVTYCCITNYPKVSGLKQQTFIISQFLWVRNTGTGRLAGCLLTQVSHKAVIKVLATAVIISKVNWVQTPFQAHLSSFWQTSEDPIPSLLIWFLVGFRSSLAVGQRPQFLATWASPQTYSKQGNVPYSTPRQSPEKK